MTIPRDNVVAKSVLSRLGFTFVRRFLELRLDIAQVRWQDIDQAALLCLCRHLQCGEEAKLTVGIDPSNLFLIQFEAIKRLMGMDDRAYLLPLGIEELPELKAFDTVF